MLKDGINRTVSFNKAAVKNAIFGDTSMVTDEKTGATISLFEGSSAEEGEYQEINVSDGFETHIDYDVDEYDQAFAEFENMITYRPRPASTITGNLTRSEAEAEGQ